MNWNVLAGLVYRWSGGKYSMADPVLRDAIASSEPPKVALPACSLHLKSLTGTHLKLCSHLDVLLIEKRGFTIDMTGAELA